MRTLAAATAMATVLTVSAAAKTLLKNPQRLLPDYISSSALNPVKTSSSVVTGGSLARSADVSIRVKRLRDHRDW